MKQMQEKLGTRYVTEGGAKLIALQATGNNHGVVLAFCGGDNGAYYVNARGMYLRTASGDHKVNAGSYICTTDFEEFFIFPRDRFQEVYKPLLASNKEIEQIKQIENSYSYHPPKGDQVDRYQELRDAFRDLAYKINELCPNSRERSLAHTNLEQAVMWANKSIACNE